MVKSLFEKSESVSERGYFGEKCLENPMTLPLKWPNNGFTTYF